MGKRFTEYSQFDLSQVNKDVLKKVGRKPGFRQEYDRT